MYLVLNRVQNKNTFFALSNVNPRLIQILFLYGDKRSTKIKTSIEFQTMHQFKPKDEYLYVAHSAN